MPAHPRPRRSDAPGRAPRLPSVPPHRLIVWLFAAYALFACVIWLLDDPPHGGILGPHAIPIAFVVFAVALLLPDPWRAHLGLLSGAVALPYLDYLNPDERARGSAVFAVLALAVLAFVYTYGRRWIHLALAVGSWLVWGFGWERRDALSSGFTVQFVIPVTLLMGTAGWAAGVVARRRRAAEEEVRLLTDRRRRERLGLARELHDSVARDLTIIAMQSAVLRTTDRPEEHEEARAAIETTARSGLDALKRLLVVLRAEDAVDGPALVRDLDAENLAGALAQATRHLALLGYQVTVSDAPEHLPRAAETTAVRVVREGTTNITKHAAPGAMCRLDTHTVEGHLDVRIDNEIARSTDATGLPSTGLGLESLAERLRVLGGTLTAGEHDGTWTLHARIPLDAPLAGSVDPAARPYPA